MDVIRAARELGKAIQADDRYIALQMAQQRNEEDEELQELIRTFYDLRNQLGAEIQKSDRNEERMKELDAQVKEAYGKIFTNPNMIAYNEARAEFQKVLNYVNQIIQGSADGQDPETIEYEESCGGNCGSCAGCG
ncbi:MAG TPA: YlbF family regulator [Clostridiales bacterium]|nr:YlbF family regulator [Clostridiales bacterium]